MSKKKLYNKGYLIRVSSWENDLDNFRTEELIIPINSSQDKDEAKAKTQQWVEFAQLFQSKNSEKEGIGNLGDDETHKVIPVLNKFREKYPDFFKDLKVPEEIDEEDDSLAYEYISYAEDLGLSGYDYFFTRVCETIKVFYFPEDVWVQDITDEF